MNTTHDGIVRLRPNEGLLIARENHTVEAASISDIAGEVVLTERAFNGGTKLTGNLPRAVLLVENLGPYLDVPSPEGWLIAHVPGWDTATVRLLLEQLVDIPVVHFGDLDPNGVRITSHLRSIRPDVRWAVPDFWREYVRKCGRRLTWPDDLNLDGTPPLVRDLAKAGLWLEQEPIILDERMSRALEDFLDPSHCLHR
ncbi:MAG TPA: Wadjet anti-phage system protein JetD domain-containing protein [Candidatus Angelobacter sp.]|nr:Wadjet anti-phage system protein JetD domain-containing protein [Candidatus Angelobacter sp.]